MRATKGCRWLLLWSRAFLSQAQEAQRQQVLQADPDLRTTYLLKEEFQLIFDSISDRDQARRFLEVGIYQVHFSQNPYLLKFGATLRAWFDQILAHFDARVSNGFVEGMNRAIRLWG